MVFVWLAYCQTGYTSHVYSTKPIIMGNFNNVANQLSASGVLCIHIAYLSGDKMNVIETTVNDWLDIEVVLHVYQLVDTCLRSNRNL